MCGKCCKTVNFQDIRKRALDQMTKTRDDLKDWAFWRGVLAEFMASMFLIMVGCGSWIDTTGYPLTIRIALAFGFMYAILIYCLRHVSGAHVNPVVSIAMAVTCKISAARALVYVLAQTLGAMLGAAFLYAITSEEYRGVLGCTVPQGNVSEGQGFGVEFFSTLILVFVTFACFEEHAMDEERRCPGHLIIGLAVAALSCFAVPLTGGSFNPARSFGPAVVRGIWTKHWIYWFGTILGGILGGVLYELIFAKSATVKRLTQCLTGAARAVRKPDATPIEKPADGGTAAERQALRDPTVMASEESIPDIEESSDTDNNEKITVKIC